MNSATQVRLVATAGVVLLAGACSGGGQDAETSRSSGHTGAPVPERVAWVAAHDSRRRDNSAGVVTGG